MVGFGPVSMNQTARAHLTLCTGDHTPTHIRTYIHWITTQCWITSSYQGDPMWSPQNGMWKASEYNYCTSNIQWCSPHKFGYQHVKNVTSHVTEQFDTSEQTLWLCVIGYNTRHFNNTTSLTTLHDTVSCATQTTPPPYHTAIQYKWLCVQHTVSTIMLGIHSTTVHLVWNVCSSTVDNVEKFRMHCN